MEEAARRIHALGPRYVLVKGGHLKGERIDLLWNGRAFTAFLVPRVDSTNTHGTGCTLSAAIAAGLARGQAARRRDPRSQGLRDGGDPRGLRRRPRRGQLRHFVEAW